MNILLVAHFIGLALGVGGATLGALMFIRSIADNLIDQSEAKLLELSTRSTFFGLFLLYFTGAGFLVIGVETTDVFWAKMAVVGVITLVESIALAFFSPLVRRFADQGHELDSDEFTEYIPLLVSVTAISLLSWYVAVAFGAMRNTTLPFEVLLGVYGSLVIFVLIAANVVAWMLGQIRYHADNMQLQKMENEQLYMEHSLHMAAGARDQLKGVNFDDTFAEIPMQPAYAAADHGVMSVNGNGLLAHARPSDTQIKGVRFNDQHPVLRI